MDSHRNSLQPGYRLHWYIIKKILGQGGFGITYLADDTNLQQEVAIKEFLPVDLAIREADASIHPVSNERGEHFKWGLDRFMSEAQTLARFKHPNIVRVNAVFAENNTAYMVMEYERGRGMHELLRENKTLGQAEVNAILLPILDGLEQIHAAGFIHRDIKPPNIFIREDGSPVLLDFGSARQSFGEQTRTLTAMVSPGFAPFEQYVGKGDRQGPWTDIYGLGATLYRAVTGRSPADAMDRSEALLHASRDVFVKASEIRPEGYSSGFLAAIDHALAFRPEDRPQTIVEWKQEFASHATPGAAAAAEAGNPAEPEAVTVAVTEPGLPGSQVSRAQDEKGHTSVFLRADKATRSVLTKSLQWAAIVCGIFVFLAVLNRIHDRHEEIAGNGQEPGQATVQPADRSAVVNRPSAAATTEATGASGETRETVDQLLSGAKQDLDALRLTTPAGNNAVEKYRAVLQIDPGNAEARNGLDRVVDEYLRMMKNALQGNDLASAGEYLDKAMRINPDHPQVISARDRLDVERERREQKINEGDGTGPAEIAVQPEMETAGKQIPDAERSTLQTLRDRIKSNPQDRQARRQLKDIADKYQQAVREAIKTHDYDGAEAYVREILKITPPRSEASKELNKLLLNINKMRAESGE